MNNNDLLKNIQKGLQFNPPDFKPNQSIVDYAATGRNRMNEINDSLERQQQIKSEKEIARIDREEKQLELLEEIKNNTGSLVNMVDMIHFNTNQQVEVTLIIAEILNIGTASTQEEADSLYKRVMGKINSTVESVESISTLSKWATMGWEHVKGLF